MLTGKSNQPSHNTYSTSLPFIEMSTVGRTL